ncbi:MAG TPA: type IV secretory system conjugative DNA transfer family protein [Actinomycetota bacterium]|nr:type IV secretory system conjugative DNA transfer family protein [Actinomycetota bacterium]
MTARPNTPARGGVSDLHPLEALALRLFGGLLAAGALVWLTGQLSALLFRGGWPRVAPSEIGAVAIRYPDHLGDPARAWPAGARELVPGPLAFYVTAAALVLPAIAAAAWWSLRRAGRAEAHDARWARLRDLRSLRARRRRRGRLSLGRVDGRLVSAEPRQSVIVIGPTQTGKTTGFAIPAILEWQGPVVATSVKTDLVHETLAARASLPGAKTWIYDPTSSTGLPPAGWTPLREALTWQGAQRVADWLVRTARPARPDIEGAAFWYAAAAKVLAPILLAAACSGGTMAQVVEWLDSQDPEPVHLALEANDEEEAINAYDAISMWDERTRGSVYATAQTVLLAYSDPGVLASAMTAELRADHLLDGGRHTAYLCAPAHEQRRLQPLFATLVHEIVAHAYERSAETGKPLDPPLLLVLDECANIAPLRDLATLASTGAGQGIQLVSIFQDMAQIGSAYGPDRAATILANHRAKIILSGISDMPTLRYITQLLGRHKVRRHLTSIDADGRRTTTESIAERELAPENLLRQLTPGHGILVYGHLPPARIALRPWFKERRLRRLAGRGVFRPEAALR